MITSLIALLMAICVLAFMFTIYYVFGAETSNNIMAEYIQEIKFDTCHAVFDIYNLTDYYNCIGM